MVRVSTAKFKDQNTRGDKSLQTSQQHVTATRHSNTSQQQIPSYEQENFIENFDFVRYVAEKKIL